MKIEVGKTYKLGYESSHFYCYIYIVCELPTWDHAELDICNGKSYVGYDPIGHDVGIWWEDGGFDSNNMCGFLYDLVEVDE